MLIKYIGRYISFLCQLQAIQLLIGVFGISENENKSGKMEYVK